MQETWQVLGLGVPFVWLGAVLGLSFLETPLKFRAPGITLQLGLGIGRLVFLALNILEVVLAALLVLAAATVLEPTGGAWWLVGSVCAVLVVQLAMRPRLDRRTTAVIAGGAAPNGHLHIAYIGLELVKVVLLVSTAIALGKGLLA